MKEIALIIGMIALGLLVLIFAPLAIIWSLNTLFSLQIAYNFWSWLAVVIMNLTWTGSLRLRK